IMSIGTSCCSSAAKTSTLVLMAPCAPTPGSCARQSSAPSARYSLRVLALFLAAFVGVDDVLHDAVAHHVARAEVHEREARDLVEDVLERGQAGAAAALGQIDLGDIAGDDDLRTE